MIGPVTRMTGDWRSVGILDGMSECLIYVEISNTVQLQQFLHLNSRQYLSLLKPIQMFISIHQVKVVRCNPDI